MTRTERPSPNPLMYHRLHNTLSIEKKKQTRLSVAEKLQLYIEVKSLCEEYMDQEANSPGFSLDHQQLLIYHRIDHSLRRNYMMKMSANNMNEPIVRWRERGVAFFMLSYHFFPCCHFTFFMLDTVH